MSRALALSRFYLRHLTQPLASLSHPSPPSPFSISCASPYATSKYPNSGCGGGDDDQQSVVSLFNRDPSAPPRLFVVQPRLRPASFLQAKLNEALCLANSLEEQRDGYFDTDFFEKELPPHVVVQNPSLRSKPRADTFFGPGTVTDIKCHLTAAESKAEEVDAVFVNTILSGIQQRNLERILDKPVLDRVGLIIEIFNAHAHTKEAKLQAELAALMYKKSRLVRVRGPDGRYTFGASAEAEVVSARGRGSGGRGFISGAGETELQLQRRRILDRRRHLLSQIEEVHRTRAVQRAARKRHGELRGEHLATVAVVGYTNAGKSTLISALSNNDLYSDARLFATLDARLRAVFLPSGRKVLLSDTVGFISDLPVQLVEAFHSTLEEVVEADLLVHVIDCTAPNLDEHRSTVLGVLKQIGVSEEKLRNMIEVWNKIDYHEEMSADNYVDDWDEAEIPREEGGGGGGGEGGEREDRTTNSDGLEENDVESEPQLSQGTPEIPDELADDSDAWLHSGDESDSLYEEWNSLNNRATGSSESTTEKASHGEATDGPHVKVSAITGVGLQELLKLIDDKLERAVDQKKMSEALIQGNSIFDRKWRPPRSRDKENEMAVEN